MLKSLLILILSLFGLAQPALAVQEFVTDYRSRYTITAENLATVAHEITITNNLSHIFPREYTLSVGSTTLSSLQTIDQAGNILDHDLTETPTGTNIHVTLKSPAIGLGQKNTFTISYTTEDVTQHTGNVWEINIPRLKQGGEMASVERQIIFPETLGSPTAAYPSPDEIKTESATTTVIYRTSRQEAISLLFGQSQWYHLKLDYYLQPPVAKGTSTELSLPPDTAYQQVVLTALDPPPSQIRLDADGNWLAQYPYTEDFNSHVTAELFVQVSPIPTFPDPSSQTVAQYLSSNKFWPVKSPEIQELGAQLKSPKNIYDYLVSSFTYNAARVNPGAERLGALKAINSPTQAICTEFTDAFVALARSQGIASREINGYAFTDNTTLRPLSLATDVLHSWPEYYDTNSNHWIQIDPTWGNTTGGLNYYHKLDYNHLTFVRHGLEATYPYPAGVYKKTVDEKTINVELAQSPPTPHVEINITTLPNQKYELKNLGNVAATNYAVALPDGSSHTLGYLPPYGIVEVGSILGAQSPAPTWLYPLLLSLAVLVGGLILYLTFRARNR